MPKKTQHLETCLLIAVSSCDIFNCLFPLDVSAIKILLLLIAGLFIVFAVEKCTACQSHWKSDFGWHRVHLT